MAGEQRAKLSAADYIMALYRVFGGLSDVPPEDAEQLRNYEQCRTAVMAESMALYHFCKHD